MDKLVRKRIGKFSMMIKVPLYSTLSFSGVRIASALLVAILIIILAPIRKAG